MQGIFYFICSLILQCLTVNGVFIDEVEVVDWQIANIGEYKCVLDGASQESLIILSDVDDQTLLSVVNSTDGSVISRHQLKLSIIDAMQDKDSGKILFKSSQNEYFDYNENFGLSISENLSVIENFYSSCNPNLSGMNLADDKLKIMDNETGLELFHANLPSKNTSILYAKTNFKGKLQVLYKVEQSEYRFEFYENGTLESFWERDESLSEVVAHVFVKIPDTFLNIAFEQLITENTFTNPLTAYSFRIQKNFNKLHHYLQSSNYNLGRILTDLMFEERVDDSSDYIKNHGLKFGLHKLLVVGTANGKIYGINTQNSKTEWKVTVEGNSEILYLDYNENSSSLMVFLKSGDILIYNLIDLFNPSFETKTQLKSSIKSVEKLGESQTYWIKYVNNEYDVLNLSNNENLSSDIYVVDHDEKSLTGYYFNDSKSDKPMDTWKIKMKDTEKIIAFSSKNDLPAANIGIVLGNKQVLYKYLYPHLSSYAKVDSKSGTLFINVIDNITGEILVSEVQDGKVAIDLPINMVFGEHWIVYTYFSAEPVPEQKVGVIELYESLTPDKRVTVPGFEYDSTNVSVFKPETMIKSYFFPQIISKIELAKTKFGITSKAILVQTQDGQITYIPKDIASARRLEETEMTDDDKKEFMRVPYVANIPLNDRYVLSHVRQLVPNKNSELVSQETALESTSIVCNLGHDLFCTRVSPSLQFDVMSPSFEKGKLLFTIVVMALILFYLGPKVRAKRHKSFWLVRD